MLQEIRPNFSGSAQSMQAAMQSVNQVGDISKDFLAQIRQDRLDKDARAERDYQHGREKIADARVATKWEQEQNARNAEIAATAGLANKQVLAAQGVGFDSQGNAGQYNQAFADKLGVQNQILQGNMNTAIASNPQAQGLLSQFSGEKDQGMIMNAEGKMVPMTAQELATEKRIDSERALLASDPVLAAKLGVDKYKKGLDALGLAINKDAPPTLGQYATQQAIANAPQPVATVETSNASTGPILTTTRQKIGSEQKLIQPAVAAKAGMTPAEFVNSHNLQGQLFGDGTKPNAKMGGRFPTHNKEIFYIDKKYDALMEPLREKLRQTYDGAAFGGQGTKTFNDTANQIKILQTKRDAEVDNLRQNKPVTSNGIVPREIWNQSTKQEHQAIVESLIGNIKDPAKRQAMSAELVTALKDTPEQKAKYKTVSIYGDVPLLSSGKEVKATVSNTYKGQVVTTRSGNPIDMTGVPETGRGVIVDAHKSFNSQVDKMFGVQDALSELAKDKVGKIATKYGVTQSEMHSDALLKSAGLDGSMTPQQERKVKQLEGDMTAAVEQYKFDYTVNKDKAEMAFKNKQLEIQTQLSKMQMAQSERNSLRTHADAVADRKVKESSFLKAFDSKSGALTAEQEADPVGFADKQEKARRDKWAGRYKEKYGDEGWYDGIFHNQSDWIDTQIATEDKKIIAEREAKKKTK